MQYKIAFAIGGIAIFAGTILFSYSSGVHDERHRQETAQAIEYANLAGRVVQATNDAEAIRESSRIALDDLRSRLATVNGMLDAERNRRTTASATLDATYPDWFAGFEACFPEYGKLAEETATYADRVNGLQLYVKAIQSQK